MSEYAKDCSNCGLPIVLRRNGGGNFQPYDLAGNVHNCRDSGVGAVVKNPVVDSGQSGDGIVQPAGPPRCKVNGCRKPGTMSNNVRQGGPWVCRWHYRIEDRAIQQQIINDMQQNPENYRVPRTCHDAK